MPGSPATGQRPKTTPRSFGLTRVRQARSKNNLKYSAASTDPNYQVSSFRDIPFESDEMQRLLAMNTPDYIEKKGPPVRYDSNTLMPDWILDNPEWRSTRCDAGDNNLISDILQVAFSGRSQEQSTVLAKWLMSVWEIANTMGFKRCISMSEAMQYNHYAPGKPIVTEGDRGLVFYIIVSGVADVHKEGIGNVAQLIKGQSFGELALTQGKDLRTASVIANTKTEVLCLHKRDYDHFVRDIQLGERRENFAAIRQCKLFEHWTRNKIERMCNTARRETFKDGDYIFRQGDQPDSLYLVVEGTLHAVRDVQTVITNRWPSSMHSWQTMSKKNVRSVFVKELTKGDYFGELSIIKNDVRRANVIAKSRCVLLTIDKLDFLHLLRHRNAIKSVLDSAGEYAEVNKQVDKDHPGAEQSQKQRKASLKFKNAVNRVFEASDAGKTSKPSILSTVTQIKAKTQPPPSPARKQSKVLRENTIARMTARPRMVKHDENETVKLFREQLGQIGGDVASDLQSQLVEQGSAVPDRPIVNTDKEVSDSSWRRQSAFCKSYPKSISFQAHDEQRAKIPSRDGYSERFDDGHVHDQETAGPVLFSPISELALINEEKSKNKVHIEMSREDKEKPLNVSVTTVLDVSRTGRRQRSVCVKNVKDLVEKTRQDWAQEVATSPVSTASPFRRQSSMGLTGAGGEASASQFTPLLAGVDPTKKMFSPPLGLQRRLSSFEAAQEDVTRDETTGSLSVKKLKVVPPEFSKPIMDRGKLTFYEIMALKKEGPPETSPRLPSLSSPAHDDRTLFSDGVSSRRRSSARPTTSPSRRKQSKAFL